jgi:hypothetical protein
MATSPQSKPLADDPELDDIYNPKPGHTFPGYTVDALLAQGKIDKAHEELERLLQEGIDSGISPESPAEMMERIRAKVRAPAANR